MSHYVSLTRIPTLLFPTSVAASRHAALTIAKLIRQNKAAGKPTVLGLATGSTPLKLYRELIRMHRDEGLDFSDVITFNLDEYYPMQPDDPQSYRFFMNENLFDHINIDTEKNTHVPEGRLKPDEIDEFCADYERQIRQAGGLDLQILGIGRTGHIGFNEPGSTRTSRTRLVTLDPVTRRDAASVFYGERNVPTRAITMGVGTIMEAKKVLLLAFGEHKAGIIRQTLEEEPTEDVTASFLQEHQDAEILLDEAAAEELIVRRRPWEAGPVSWTEELTRRAVLWLALDVNKPLLKLSDDDFRERHLYDLLYEQGPAAVLGERIFQDRLETITNHPAGKEPKTILIFSPHPDDDVISMGGTLIRLAQQGHDVHIAYMTSGNVAVFDHDARRFIDFADAFARYFNVESETSAQIRQRLESFLNTKAPGQPDDADILEVKKLIREAEARSGAEASGVPPQNCHFLNLRFYQTGKATKNPVQPEDIADIVELIQRLKPYQVYMAGEMSDPHGTHRICAEAIFESLGKLPADALPEVWLYRGAWEEWPVHEIERAVPLGPEIMEQKKLAIFRHQSQKDRAMFPGKSDGREFWQRAEDRNRGSATIYDALGLPEYYALEAFVRWRPEHGL